MRADVRAHGFVVVLWVVHAVHAEPPGQTSAQYRYVLVAAAILVELVELG